MTTMPNYGGGHCQEALNICKYHQNTNEVWMRLQMSNALSSDLESWSTLCESRPTSFPPAHSLVQPEGRGLVLGSFEPPEVENDTSSLLSPAENWVSKCSRTQIISLKHPQWPRNLIICLKSSRSKNQMHLEIKTRLVVA